MPGPTPGRGQPPERAAAPGAGHGVGQAHLVGVEDTGIGIPEEDLRDVGRRFFRASSVTAQTTPGTGLGLSIVQSIAAAHGGRMSLDSAPGQGTIVTLHLTSVAEGEAPEDEHHGVS